jgi:hypothetical protein
MAYSRKRTMKKYGGKHKHTKSCKHSHKKRTRMNGGKHRHSAYCAHKRSGHKRSGRRHMRTHKMNGGNYLSPLSPAPFTLGGAMGVNESANTIYNAANYSSSEIPHSNVMQGGRRSLRSRRNKRGGTGYSFLPSGTELTAKNSGLANVAPYELYEEIVQK